jgi:hypothetical protein
MGFVGARTTPTSSVAICRGSTTYATPVGIYSRRGAMLGNTVSAAVAAGFATAKEVAIAYYDQYTEIYAEELRLAKVRLPLPLGPRRARRHVCRGSSLRKKGRKKALRIHSVIVQSTNPIISSPCMPELLRMAAACPDILSFYWCNWVGLCPQF